MLVIFFINFLKIFCSVVINFMNCNTCELFDRTKYMIISIVHFVKYYNFQEKIISFQIKPLNRPNAL